MKNMEFDGRRRVVIENVSPAIDGGDFPIKRVIGEKVIVHADIFGDGHDEVGARLLYRPQREKACRKVIMRPVGNDRWEGIFTVDEAGIYYYTVMGWIDHFLTWQKDLRKKIEAGQDVQVDLLIGAGHLEKMAKDASEEDREKLMNWSGLLRREKDTSRVLTLLMSSELETLQNIYHERDITTIHTEELQVVVDRKKALFSTWYEMFPRSCGGEDKQHGTFKDCESLLPEISGMGFDVLYLPPIHPIGTTKRKGKNNSPVANPDDPGSPWAIGSIAGGHKAILKDLGTMKDFERLVKKSHEHDMEIAMDIAFQCTPDHPYVKDYKSWFRWRPDGKVQHAENPPKKYEDILPINFETEEWPELWNELKGVITFWIEKGVRIFRVDNPHTKPYMFWEWLITETKKDYPDVIFLSEAFTRPKVMYRLAKLGFSQSYTYFSWRNTKWELTQYLTELTQTELKDYLRPNFWPNTPDILPEYLQYGRRPAFMIRLALAATLSSNYGIYGPAYELCVDEALPGKEEYLNSEKYEIKNWNRNYDGNIKDFIRRVNIARKDNPALQSTSNLKFCETDNNYLIFYAKTTEDLSNIVLVVVNLDPFHTQSGWVNIPIGDFGIESDHPYMVHDLVSDDKYIWQGERNYVELNPHILPAHIFRLRKRLKREMDFDYFF